MVGTNEEWVDRLGLHEPEEPPALWGNAKQVLDLAEATQPTRADDAYVYFIRSADAVKVGYTVDPCNRIAALQTGNGEYLRLYAFIKGGVMKEREVHDRLWRWRLQGEWFEWCDEVEDIINSYIPASHRKFFGLPPARDS